MNTTTPSILRRCGGLSIIERTVDRGSPEVLRGGDRIRICPVHRDDRLGGPAAMKAISPDARRFRFVMSMTSPDVALRQWLAGFDPKSDLVYVAKLDDLARNQEVGVARLTTVAGAHGCDFDLVVAEKWRKKGIGTRLMHHLVEAARQRGLQSLYSGDEADKACMSGFAARIGLLRDRNPADTRNPADARRVSYRLYRPAC